VAEYDEFGGFGGSEGGFPLYSVETGEDSASVFCTQRESAIVYEHYRVDHASTELIYTLPLLESTYPYHLISGTAYFKGTGRKTYQILINDEKKLTLTVNANQPEDFEILIPREYYYYEHHVTLSIRNPENGGVHLAGLKVYRLTDRDPFDGGPQSRGSSNVTNTHRLVLRPNPFSTTLDILLNIPQQCSKEASLRIYDATGRLVKKYSNVTTQPLNRISWNGCDETGERLPKGIYFIELKSGNESITEKVIMLK